jgi:dihydrodipicolinate reductase
LASLKDYEWSLEETHHLEKKDAPSGTAKKMVEENTKYFGTKECLYFQCS